MIPPISDLRPAFPSPSSVGGHLGVGYSRRNLRPIGRLNNTSGGNSVEMATAMMSAPATVAAATGERDQCEWCGQGPWAYKCRMCDPRRVKLVCLKCANLWHTRGASQKHLLEDRSGRTQTYSEWPASILGGQAKAGVSTEKQVMKAPVVATGSADPAEPPAKPANGILPDPPTAMTVTPSKDAPIDQETALPDERTEDAMDESVEFEHGGGEDQGAEEEEVPEEIPAQLSEATELELEDVLDRWPTDDAAVLDALADHLHDAIRVEDAVQCERYTQCDAPSCQQFLSHHRHVQERKECSEPMCQRIASYRAHMEFCQRKSCPFCVRIQQRRLFGKKQGLDLFIHRQKKLLPELRKAGDRARIQFTEDQIAAFEKRKQRAIEDVERLNRLALDEHLPMFNFPRFTWHIVPEPLIKIEPGLSDESQLQPEVGGETNRDSEETKNDQSEEQGQNDRVSNEDGTEEASVVDYIGDLIAKKYAGDESAKQKFEESINLAFRIVDASFCSPSKASRCLLNCQGILVHLQHHVDVKVCKGRMCEIVEQHFSHMSKCQSEETEKKCEYCLRVMEREYSRAVEVMETERPETELKIQRLINAITESLTNDPGDEREQNIMQLEDELQQAEDYKKALLSKIDAASLRLVKCRRRLKQHPANPPSSYATGLPLHFIKTARPGANAALAFSLQLKKRRT